MRTLLLLLALLPFTLLSQNRVAIQKDVELYGSYITVGDFIGLPEKDHNEIRQLSVFLAKHNLQSTVLRQLYISFRCQKLQSLLERPK